MKRLLRACAAVSASLALHLLIVEVAGSYVFRSQSRAEIPIVALEAPEGGGEKPKKEEGVAKPEAKPEAKPPTPKPQPKQPKPAVAKAAPVPAREAPTTAKSTATPMPSASPSTAAAPTAGLPASPGLGGTGGQGLGNRIGAGRSDIDLDSPDDPPEWMAWKAEVRRRIQAKFHYPRSESHRGVVELEIRFQVYGTGQLGREFIDVRRSSGSKILDGNAVQAIREAAPFPPLPQNDIPVINPVMRFQYRPWDAQ